MEKQKIKSALFCAAAMGAVLLASCSSESRYKVLNFLLDGVPPPKSNANGAPAQAPSSGQEKPAQPAEVAPASHVSNSGTSHPPYEAKMCDACHDAEGGSNGLKAVPPDLCYQCHEPMDKAGPVVHWPVKQGRCLSCHNPHSAGNEKLLNIKVPNLCFQCHNPGLLAHGSDMGLCTDCHSPHSAGERLIKAQ